MFIKREIIGSVVTLVFYFGIMSTLFSFATGVTTEDIKHSGTEHGAKTVSFVGNGGYFYSYKQ